MAWRGAAGGRAGRVALGIGTAAVSALGLVACTSSGAARTPPTTSTAVQVSRTGAKVPVTSQSNALRRTAARRAAQQLMSEVRLPATAKRAEREPPGDGGTLKSAQQGVSDRDQADLHAFFVAPGTPDSILNFAKRYPPTYSRASGSGSGSGPGIPTVKYVTFLAIYQGVLDQGGLIVAAVALTGGGTGIRVDAQVTWNPPRPPGSTIPAGARILRVVLSRGLNQVNGHAPFTIITKAAPVIAAVRQRINALVVQPPGSGFSCPMDNGQSLTMTFRKSPNDPPVAIAKADVSGCEFVSVSRAGHVSRATLRGSGLAPFVERVLAVSAIAGA